jgi:hypothetical protein
MTKIINCTTIFEVEEYQQYVQNCTSYDVGTADDEGQVTIPILDDYGHDQYTLSIAATSLRTNRIYIRVYILWLNLIVQVINKQTNKWDVQLWGFGSLF